MHGELPKAEDLDQYEPEELRHLQEELRQSVQKRIEVTDRLGPDKGHGERQAAEQRLIRQIEKFLLGQMLAPAGTGGPLKAIETGEDLLAELLTDPRKFVEKGRPYALLQAYFQGLTIESLRPLLRSDNPWIQSAAGYVASELGGRARDLTDDIVVLLGSSEPLVQNYAMEVLAVCDTGGRFVHVIEVLESQHMGLRLQAMDLVARASAQQLEGALDAFQSQKLATHVQGLSVLLAGDRDHSNDVIAELQDSDPLVRRYGAIAVKRFGLSDSRHVCEVISGGDSELRSFFPGLTAAEPD